MIIIRRLLAAFGRLFFFGDVTGQAPDSGAGVLAQASAA
jgi:hypothetical protein